MIVTFEHKDWKKLEEAEVTKTTFYGVQAMTLDPDEGLLALKLQSGWIYEHFVQHGWTYTSMPEDGDDYVAVTLDGNPRGTFRGIQ
ncbi:MAG: hypothetical protein ACXABY_27650 [Candidatus Thorarchaeota archaeon]|jgi:hypothetical protein